MSPHHLESPSSTVVLRRGLAVLLAAFLLLVSGRAALVRWDVSGPVTRLSEDTPGSLGNLKLGDLLAGSFAYDTAELPPGGSGSDQTSAYHSYGTDEADISVHVDGNDYSFSRLGIFIMKNTTWYLDDGTAVAADSINLLASDENNFARFNALFLWPALTLGALDPVIPEPAPALVQIYWIPGYVDRGPWLGIASSTVQFGDFPPPPPPVISPVPEPSTFGLAGAALLLGLIARRRAGFTRKHHECPR